MHAMVVGQDFSTTNFTNEREFHEWERMFIAVRILTTTDSTDYSDGLARWDNSLQISQIEQIINACVMNHEFHE